LRLISYADVLGRLCFLILSRGVWSLATTLYTSAKIVLSVHFPKSFFFFRLAFPHSQFSPTPSPPGLKAVRTTHIITSISISINHLTPRHAGALVSVLQPKYASAAWSTELHYLEYLCIYN